MNASTPAASPLAASRARFEWIDALRGFAMLWMAAYHFAFDLKVFGYTQSNFATDPFWYVQRTCILSTFLLCAGMALAIAHGQGQSWPKFWKRWAQIAGCALLVSVATYLTFGERYVYFGVLHGIAVMLILTRVALARRWLLWLAVLAALFVYGSFKLDWVAQYAVATHYFPNSTSPVPAPTLWDSKWLNWIGLVTRKPPTEDYVPLLPWLLVMLAGALLGQWILRRNVQIRLPRVALPLATLGRWSLTFYMLHQPVFWALLYLYQAFMKNVPV